MTLVPDRPAGRPYRQPAVGGLVAGLFVLGSSTLARRALDRRRLHAWDTEWRATGPLWSGHRG